MRFRVTIAVLFIVLIPDHSPGQQKEDGTPKKSAKVGYGVEADFSSQYV
jgi:hypothetical protein